LLQGFLAARLVCLLATSAVVLAPVPSTARQGVATPSPGGATVAAADCRVEPRPVADFFAVAAETPASATPAPVESGPPPTDGIPAAPVVVAQAVEALDNLAACGAAGDPRLSTALWSDRFFRRALAGRDLETVLVRRVSPEPVPVRAPEVVAVSVLPDRRVLVQTQHRDERTFIALVEEDGRFLLDEIFSPPVAATPVPEHG